MDYIIDKKQDIKSNQNKPSKSAIKYNSPKKTLVTPKFGQENKIGKTEISLFTPKFKGSARKGVNNY